LHAVYSSLHTQSPNVFKKFYPLQPPSLVARNMNLVGTMHAGAGIYLIATQPASDPGFTLSFTAQDGAPISPSFAPRMSVMRLQ
jgi:hypothetical protein